MTHGVTHDNHERFQWKHTGSNVRRTRSPFTSDYHTSARAIVNRTIINRSLKRSYQLRKRLRYERGRNQSNSARRGITAGYAILLSEPRFSLIIFITIVLLTS